MNFGTWNIKGLRTKQKEVIAEIRRLQMDIVVLTETKRKGTGTEQLENYVHIYSGVDKANRAKAGVSLLISKKFAKNIKDWSTLNERIIMAELKIKRYQIVIVGVYAPANDEPVAIKDQHDEQLCHLLDSISNRKEILLLGDLNGHVGCRKNDKIIGPYGDKDVNDNGERLIELCHQYSLRVQNGFFKHKDIHKYTWTQPTLQRKSIIDFMLTRQVTQLKVHDVKVLRSAECGTDHHLVRAKVLFPLTRHSKDQIEVEGTKVCEPRFNLSGFRDESTVFLYKLRLNLKLSKVTYSSAIKTYENILTCLKEAASEALGYLSDAKNNDKKNEWWSEDLEKLIREKKKAYHAWLVSKDAEDRRHYTRCRNETKIAVIKAKNEAWDFRCKQIDQHLGYTRASEAWKTLKALKTNRKENYHINMIPLTDWKDYYQNLYTEDRPKFLNENNDESNTLNTTLTEDDLIRPSEIRKVLMTMKNGRASGPNGIPMELLKNGPDVLMQLLSYVFNCFLKGEELPREWKTAYISNLHKKGDKKQCSNYRGLSVTNSVSRLYGKIIKNRIEYQFKEEEEQNGFRAGRSCSDNLFCLKQVLEKRLARNLETHMIFIDLKKAYDSVPLSKLWLAMSENGISDLYIQAVKNLYSDMTSRIKIGGKLSEEFLITKGLRQGCAIAPTLFKIYLNSALRQWRRACRNMGVSIGDDKLFTLHFADDQAIFAEDEDDIFYMIRKLDDAYHDWGLTINMEKTEYLVAGANDHDLELDRGTIGSTNSYKYLGVNITKDGSSENEIKIRIGQGKGITKQLNGVLWSKHIRPEIKIRIYKTLVESIMTYGAEVWELTEQLKKRLLAAEMSFWRRCCRLTLMDKVRNEEIRERMNIQTTIIDTVESKSLRWYGHVNRMDHSRWPKKLLQWIPPQRRKRGRPRRIWADGIKTAMTSRNLQDEDWRDRDRWKLGCDKRL